MTYKQRVKRAITLLQTAKRLYSDVNNRVEKLLWDHEDGKISREFFDSEWERLSEEHSNVGRWYVKSAFRSILVLN